MSSDGARGCFQGRQNGTAGLRIVSDRVSDTCRPNPPGRRERISRPTSFSSVRDGIVAWLVANSMAVAPLTAHAGGRLGMVGATRAAVYPMRNYVYRLVTTSFRPIIPALTSWLNVNPSLAPLRSVSSVQTQ